MFNKRPLKQDSLIQNDPPVLAEGSNPAFLLETSGTSLVSAAEKVDLAYSAELPASQSALANQTSGISRMFSSFKHRNYQLWFGGQLLSVIGTWMQIIAQGWLVYELSKSEFMLGVVSFASAIPLLFVSPWGGVITDIMPRRTMLVITQTSAMLLAFVLSVLTFTHTVLVWHILVLAACLGIINAFDAPARQAFVVDMVGKGDLPNAIALNSMMFNSARVLGPAVGGILLAALGPAWCFLINGISYLAVIFGLLMMRVNIQKMSRKVEQPLRQFVEGVQYASRHTYILGLLLLAIVFSLFGMAYSALLPAFVDQVLHQDAAAYGYLNTAIGVGAVAGAFLVALYFTDRYRGKTLTWANMIYPLLLAGFGFNILFPISLALAFFMGMMFMLQLNTINSLLQLYVEDRMRGRVMSLYTLTFFGISPFGSLAAGFIAEKLTISWTIGISALGMFIFSLWVHLRIPRIRNIN